MSNQVIDKVGYTHDKMIDFIIANPRARNSEIARVFGYSTGWVSQVTCSDMFQARVAERRGEIVDPVLVATLEERLNGVMAQSLEVIAAKLEAQPGNTDLALSALKAAGAAKAYGARGAVQQNSFVLVVPEKAADADEWAKRYGPRDITGEIVRPEAGPRVPPTLALVPDSPRGSDDG